MKAASNNPMRYSLLTRKFSSHGRNWSVRPAFSPPSRVTSVSETFVNQSPTSMQKERELRRKSLRPDVFFRLRSFVGRGMELIAGVAVLFYVIAALALAAALLFFTFAR